MYSKVESSEGVIDLFLLGSERRVSNNRDAIEKYILIKAQPWTFSTVSMLSLTPAKYLFTWGVTEISLESYVGRKVPREAAYILVTSQVFVTVRDDQEVDHLLKVVKNRVHRFSRALQSPNKKTIINFCAISNIRTMIRSHLRQRESFLSNTIMLFRGIHWPWSKTLYWAHGSIRNINWPFRGTF